MLTTAIRVGCVSAWAVFDCAIDRFRFESYIDRSLVPTISKGDAVIMDNLPAHKSAAVVKAIEEAGTRGLMLPPFSPDFEPIEMIFSKPKMELRAMSKRAVPGLMSAIGTVLRTVKAKDNCGWFRKCGYDYKQK